MKSELTPTVCLLRRTQSSSRTRWVISLAITWLLLHAHSHTRTHTRTHTCMYAHMHTHTHTHTHTHAHTHMHVRTRTHTHTHTCMYAHTHAHTHTDSTGHWLWYRNPLNVCSESRSKQGHRSRPIQHHLQGHGYRPVRHCNYHAPGYSPKAFVLHWPM